MVMLQDSGSGKKQGIISSGLMLYHGAILLHDWPLAAIQIFPLCLLEQTRRLVNGIKCMLPKFLPFNLRAIFVTHLVMLGCLSGRISGYVHLIYFKTSKGWCHRFMGWYFFFFLVHYFCPWKLFLHLILCCLALERAAHYLLETNVLFQSFFF